MNGGQRAHWKFVDSLTSEQLSRVDAIGNALFEGHPFRTGPEGLVVAGPFQDTSGRKDCEDDGPEWALGPEAGPRQGRQGTSSPPAYANASELIRWSLKQSALRRELTLYYPSAKFASDPVGQWLVVRAWPIGRPGPQAFFLAAVPTAGTVTAWGFWQTDDGVLWIGPRHTNGDGSICAFPSDGDALVCPNPILRYVDLLSQWSARHLYCALRDRWPGKQEGRSPVYRYTQTRPGECCPRCATLDLYENCCRSADAVQVRQAKDRGTYGPEVRGLLARCAPAKIEASARRNGRQLPSIRGLLLGSISPDL